MNRGLSTQTVVVVSAVLVFATCSLLPVMYLLSIPLSAGKASADILWLDARQRALLWNTGVLGTGTAVLATAIGTPLGVALARVALPFKAFFRVALTAPVVLPPYIVALAWTYLGSSRGIVASLTGHDLLANWTYSLPAALVVLSLVYYPLSMLATEAAMRRIDGHLEEAGLLVARPARVFSRITLPLAGPSVLAAALLTFVLAVSEFGVPGLLRVRVYTTEVFTAFAAFYDFGRALVLAVPLLVLCIVVATITAAVAGERFVTSRRISGTPSTLLANWRRSAAAAALVVLAFAVGLPSLVLMREAFGARSARTVLEGSANAIATSLVLATIGATAVLMVAVCLGYGRARARGRVGQLADVAFIVAFAVPSTIVGVGLIGVWNRAGILGAAYGTDAMFLLAYLARFVPVAALIVAAAIRSVPTSHEEAAAVSGAGWVRTLARVVVPQVQLGLLAAWVVAFVLAFGELGVSILVAPPGEATLPIRVYTIIANTPPSHVALLALLQTAVVFTPLALIAAALYLRESR